MTETTTTTTGGYGPLAGDGSVLATQARWAVDLLGHAGPADDQREHLVPSYWDRYPTGLVPVLDRWRPLGPFTVRAYAAAGHKIWVNLTGATGTRCSLMVNTDRSGLIRVLTVQAEPSIPDLDSWADLDAMLDEPGVTAAALAGRLERQGWVWQYEREADRLMPAGSVYKTYILHALVTALGAGRLSWDEEVTMLPTLRSLPTGEMQDLPDGTRTSVRDTAFNMFARSDNTAATLLLDRVGRAAVEDAVVEAGHSRPELLRPFLSSRELFEIGWGAPDLIRGWAAGDEADRRRLLARIDHPQTVRVEDLRQPAHQAGLDWFMSARDAATVLAELWQAGSSDSTGTLRVILTAYPGVPIERDRWPVSTFKGGSSPGAMMFCWLLEDTDGVPHVLVLRQESADQALLGDGQRLRFVGEQVIHRLLWRR
jgi:Beta-lactamase enzyme family/ORF 12 gene product N-terminal